MSETDIDGGRTIWSESGAIPPQKDPAETVDLLGGEG